EADRRFHLALLGLAGNQRLVETVSDLRKRPRLYGLTALDERGELIPSAEEHLELLDVMLTGDVEAAAAAGLAEKVRAGEATPRELAEFR
ncbi:FCD domain-containing protein, partial [Streptomyces sp. NRRL S-1896]|uniref:FCD domain-containing protein n=1 Tax=Streptomyces sp. NRRL S-1896 TaxID=1463893 RepID=UPI0004CC94CC